MCRRKRSPLIPGCAEPASGYPLANTHLGAQIARGRWNRHHHRRRGGQGPRPRHPEPLRRARRRPGRDASPSSAPRRRSGSRPASATAQVFGELGVHAGPAAPRGDPRRRPTTRPRRRAVRDATGIFLTGGNQLRLSSTIGGTRLADAILERFRHGAVVAGTSAPARRAMSQPHDRVRGVSGATPKHRMAQIAAGLGVLPGVIVDQHFQQRNRLGRLLSLIAQNPIAARARRRRGHGRRRRPGPRHGGHRARLDHRRRRRRSPRPTPGRSTATGR